ncbi:MAG: hypothetical protein J6V15_02670 [Clostridia bacterium]|nr:hypothetical protein [Clostridia bacterium]
MTDKAIYQAALDTYGAESQTLMLFEEMSELQKELCKRARGKKNTVEIAEEIADVKIMLEQMILLHDCEIFVQYWHEFKTRRLQELLGLSD